MAPTIRYALPSKMRPGDLPDFEVPPVVEVALGVQFEPLAGFKSMHLALLWEHWRESSPNWEDQPPLPPVKEWFGLPGLPPGLDFHFEVGAPPLRRAMFSDTDGTELRQVQADRFARNWRKTVSPYPHYNDDGGQVGLRARFLEDLEFLAKFAEENGLGNIAPNQCEVTYVNHVPVAGELGASDLSQLLAPWRGGYSDEFLATPETVEVRLRFLIAESGTSLGRLHVVAAPARDQTSGELLTRLTLTARGNPIGSGIEGVMRFLDVGRRHVVKGFASLTTGNMHEKWRRKDGG